MDIDILLALQGLRQALSPTFNAIFEALRSLGEATTLMAVASVLLWGVDKRAGYFVMFNAAWGLLINQFIKITACVYRPWIRDARVTPADSALGTATGYSFPSAHTALSVAMWAGTGVGLRRRFRWIMPVGIAISALVAFSRMYVGVHTPQDVLVSAVIGVALIIVSSRVFDCIDKNTSRANVVYIVGIVAALILAIYASCKSYPMDYVDGVLLVNPDDMINDAYLTVGVAAGFFSGWFIERKFIKFSTEGKPITKIIRVSVGFFVMLGLNKVLGSAFSFLGHEMAQVLSTFVLMIYATAVYPLVFTKIERALLNKSKS